MEAIKEKILLVDDSDDTILILTKKLNEYEVITAKSGEEMWSILKKEDPSLILLDVVMPDEDGFEIARKLSSIEKYSHIPVVFISAKSDGKDVESGFNSGGFDYIKKPFDLVEMKARIRSVIRKKRLEEDLKALTFTDPLTGIYNRRFFFDTLFKTIDHWRRSEGKHFSIAIIDLDFFKAVNDTFGHQAGDTVLAGFAQIIKNSIRPYDTLARYGGEEFIILLTDCNKGKAVEVIARVQSNNEKAVIKYKDTQIKFTFSCGISDTDDIESNCESEGSSMEELIEIADRRLYTAKMNGRNQVVLE